MILPCLLLLGFFTSPTDQAAASSQEVKQKSWNCTIEKTVKVLQGEAFTIYSHVDPNDRCHFLFTHQDNNYQCCYEDKYDKNCESFNYINDPRCLKNDNYNVEIDSRGRSLRNTCNFTTFNADSTSYGTYQVFNNEGQHILVYRNSIAIQKCNIVVEKTQNPHPFTLYLLAVVAVSFVYLFIWGLVMFVVSYRKRMDKKRMDKKEREKDEQIFRHLSDQDSENFKKKLGRKSIFNLRDTNHNNIYHIASQVGWTKRINDIVINHIGPQRENSMTGKRDEPRAHYLVDDEAQDDEAQVRLQAQAQPRDRTQELIESKTGIFMTKASTHMPAVLAKYLDPICPNWFWPNKWDYPNISLDSKNKEGDTPLMIAAGQGQYDTLRALIDNGADVKVTNGKETVLYKAMLGYSASRGEEDGYTNDYINIFVKLVEAGVPFLYGNEKETLLQMIVQLGDDYRDIVKELLAQDNSWRSTRDNRFKTLYNAVAGGHKEILHLLIEDGKLQWKNYNGDCLLRAVEENNKTAVNFIFGKTFPLPTDIQNKNALAEAKRRQEAFKKTWKTNATITADHIVDKLSSILSRPISIDPRKEEKDQYMSFLDHVRGKSNDKAYENAIVDLAKFADHKHRIETVLERESPIGRVLSERSLLNYDHSDCSETEDLLNYDHSDSSDTEDPDGIRNADHQPIQDPPSR
jgi:hypothetical protein